LYPIILESSFQAQFLKPMAITLAYGVLVGTAFILMFFPVLILLKNDMKMAIAYGMRRYKLWLKMGERNIQLTEQQRKHLSERPSRESLEKAIIHQNRKIE
jgi:predicted RND superfamily exporter protein